MGKTDTAKFFDKKMIVILGILIIIDLAMLSTGSFNTLDLRPYYTGEQGRALLNSFTPAQHKNYLTMELLDLALLVTYTTALILSYKKLFPTKYLLLLLPIFTGIFDLIETGVIVSILKNSNLDSMLNWLGIFTSLKWIFFITTITVLINGLRKAKGMIFFSLLLLVSSCSKESWIGRVYPDKTQKNQTIIGSYATLSECMDHANRAAGVNGSYECTEKK